MATTIMHSVVSAGFSMSTQRLLVFGGIALIAGGMLFGDIFAVFVLHQNGGETSAALLAATQAVAAQNPAAVKDAFTRIGGLLEDRGTKVDAHVHLIGEVWGLLNYFRSGKGAIELPQDRTWERRILLSGGTVLVLLGFLYGAWYAGMNLYGQEARERKILGDVLDAAVASSPAAA